MNNHQELLGKIANRAFQTSYHIDDLEIKFPPRNLSEGAAVTRFAPSPTGFLHIGGMRTLLASYMIARSTGGVFFLRIEDTDDARFVDTALLVILQTIKSFNIDIDEGVIGVNEEKGNYGPYTQTSRKEFYHTVAKKLFVDGNAYLDFTPKKVEGDEDEKLEINEWRDKPLEDVLTHLEAGKSFIVRLRAPKNTDAKVSFYDYALRHDVEMPENDLDMVLLKSNGIPTYHLAHVCDDHFMRTTHVVRTNEWLSSTPRHIQLFNMLGFDLPKYIHPSTIDKIDPVTHTQRKLSKRKDPEATMAYFIEKGYPKEAVMAYLMNMLNSSFEDWRTEHRYDDIFSFPFSAEKLPASPALYNPDKLDNIAKDEMSKIPATDLYGRLVEWATINGFETELVKLINHKDYIIQILDIERDTTSQKGGRKDIAIYGEFFGDMNYFFDDEFVIHHDDSEINSVVSYFSDEDKKNVLSKYLETYSDKNDKDTWLANMRAVCESCGYAAKPKEFTPESVYKGSMVHVSQLLRVLITGRAKSPDLYAVSKVLGNDRIAKRLLAL